MNSNWIVVSQERDPTIRTIEHIAQWLERMINDQPASPGDQADKGGKPSGRPPHRRRPSSACHCRQIPSCSADLAPTGMETDNNGRATRMPMKHRAGNGHDQRTWKMATGKAVVMRQRDEKSERAGAPFFVAASDPHPKHTINRM